MMNQRMKNKPAPLFPEELPEPTLSWEKAKEQFNRNASLGYPERGIKKESPSALMKGRTSKSVEPVGETIDITNSGETGWEGDKLSSQGSL